MRKMRKTYSASDKAKIALEALKGDVTLNQLTAKYQVHSTQINAWKKRLKEGVAEIFKDQRSKEDYSKEALIEELYKKVGQLQLEIDWLKKNLNYSTETRRGLIEPAHPFFSIDLQCDLLNLSRSSYYYLPLPVDALTLQLLRLIDEEYTQHPFIGTRRMTNYLNRLGYAVNRKRMQRLYQIAGIEAVYPKPKTSQPSPENRVYPYLLRNVGITHNNQVWSTDITYIRLKTGYLYLVAIIDWFSRYVLDWQLSTSLEADFCIETLKRTLMKNSCEIFNSDQGSQFTSTDFTRCLLSHEIKISMDGRGRALDNIFVERLWRSVKYECIYLQDFYAVKDVTRALVNYFDYYNHRRPHQSLDYKTPAEIYFP